MIISNERLIFMIIVTVLAIWGLLSVNSDSWENREISKFKKLSHNLRNKVSFKLIELLGWILIGSVTKIQHVTESKCDKPLPPKMQMCYITWKQGIKIADGIKVVNQLAFWQEDYPELCSMPKAITGVLKHGKRRQKKGSQYYSVKRLWLANPCFEGGVGSWTKKKKNAVAFRSWRRQSRMQPCIHCAFNPNKAHFRILMYRTIK